MSEIKLETLTPVHVGSGNMLQYNTDFVVAKNEDEDRIGVIDDKKILALVGSKNVENWLLSIERNENTTDFVKRYAPNARVSDYSKRTIFCDVNGVKTGDTLKECIHNGLGISYIPGSSIKGAIRTAITASLAGSINDLEGKIMSKNRPSAKKVEQDLFGVNVNEDLFRFLQVGDAYFEKDVELATRMINLNIREKKGILDRSTSQLVEAIDKDMTSIFQLKVCSEYHQWIRSKSSDRFSLKALPTEMNSISTLFSTVNQHTLSLLKNQIEFWSDYNDYDEVQDYIGALEEIQNQATACISRKSCILRIGHASGWRFITGAWTEGLSNFESEVVKASRKNNQNYEGYPFPKTVRVDDYHGVFGFVKLSISD